MNFLVTFFLIFGILMVILTIVSLSAIDTKLIFGPKSIPPKPREAKSKDR